MAAETGFTINGRIYEEVPLSDLDTDERFILYEYSKIRQEDFFPGEGETEQQADERVRELLKHPGFWPALWHCAYRRVHPEQKFDAIRAVIGKQKFVEVMRTIGAEIDEDDVPLALTSEPQPQSATSSLSNDASSGNSSSMPGDDSSTSSDRPAGVRSLTGGSSSDTSRISAQEISAA